MMAHRIPNGYETKFKGFIELCETTAEGDVIIIAHPSIIGDTYEELIESLLRVARAKALLSIGEG